MSEDHLLNDRVRAARAQELLNDELLTEGFVALESAYINAWRASRPDQPEAREKLYLAVNVIGKLKEHLQAVIANGKLADAELRAMIEDQERKKRFRIL